jgi:glycosyltransferase involved in cell wall biosynthesis
VREEGHLSVLVDGRYRGHHGIARYAAEVVPRLQARLQADVLTSGAPGSTDFLQLGRQLRRREPGLFYSPGFHAAWPTSVRQLLTVHDVIHLDVPSERTRQKTLYYRLILRPAVFRAGVVFTVSDFSRKRLVEQLDLDPSGVIVTGNGCSATFLEPVAAERPARPYVICVTNVKPYKNFRLMARAAARLPPEWTVTCVGISAEAALPAVAEAERHRFSFVTGAGDSQLRDLYAGAVALAIPSRMEGFGLPAVEAMAQGTPVVYCAEAMDEVTQGTGFRVGDPDDQDAFADALIAAAASGERARARRMELARSHTWDAVAERVTHALLAHGAVPKMAD